MRMDCMQVTLWKILHLAVAWLWKAPCTKTKDLGMAGHSL